MYIKGVDKKTVYRIPFTSSYTADLTKKTAVITGSVEVDGSFSVSGDGKMAGAALPWPNTYIYNMETKEANMRHVGQFGCNCNIAPDNSYRFFHFGDEHNLIHVFEANLVNSYTDISTTNVPLGNNNIGQSNPRWTSNVNFMSIVSPNHTDDPDDWTFENDANLGWSAAKVQQMPLYMAGAFYLGKFGADFKSVTWITISGGDRRINDGTAGMVWVAENPGTSSLTNERAVVDNKAQAIVYARNGSITATFSPMERGTVSILTPAGRLVAASTGVGSAVCEIGNQPAGTYVVKVSTASRGASTSTRIVQ